MSDMGYECRIRRYDGYDMGDTTGQSRQDKKPQYIFYTESFFFGSEMILRNEIF